MTWKTGSSPAGEELMTRSTSAVAFCCSSASSRSRLNSATFLFRSAADDLRWCATFGAVRRFGVAAFRRRDVTDAEPALERRRIAHPRLRTTPIFKGDYSTDLRLAKWGSGSVCTAAILSHSCPLWVISCHATRPASRQLYPRKRTRQSPAGAAALGQSRKSPDHSTAYDISASSNDVTPVRLPSMLMAMPFLLNTPVNAALVNWPP